MTSQLPNQQPQQQEQVERHLPTNNPDLSEPGFAHQQKSPSGPADPPAPAPAFVPALSPSPLPVEAQAQRQPQDNLSSVQSKHIARFLQHQHIGGKQDSSHTASPPPERSDSPHWHQPKSLRPFVHAIMAFEKGRKFSTGTSVHRKRQMSTLVEKEGHFGPALTVCGPYFFFICLDTIPPDSLVRLDGFGQLSSKKLLPDRPRP